jgi:sucrose-6-phosphate hydrolase SacC (GH32 family)
MRNAISCDDSFRVDSAKPVAEWRWIRRASELGLLLGIGAISAFAATDTGWIKSPKNPMLSLGPAGAFDHHNIFAPCVVKDGGKYLMYYAGGPDGAKSGEELMRYQIGLAVSDDGETWRKTGEPLLPLGKRDDFHAAPALLRTPEGELLKIDGTWHLFYNGNRPDDVEHATSRDGMRWEKDPRSPIFQRAYAPHFVQVGNEVRMYYVEKPKLADGKRLPWQISVATGKDIYSLVRHPSSPMLVVSQPWEDRALVYPYVLRENGTWVMFYAAYWKGHPKARTATAIGTATSTDGLNWTKSAANPAVTPTPGSAYDSIYTSSQSVIRDGDIYRLYYGARIDMVHKYFSIGLATKRGKLVDAPTGP